MSIRFVFHKILETNVILTFFIPDNRDNNKIWLTYLILEINIFINLKWDNLYFSATLLESYVINNITADINLSDVIMI